MATSPDLVRLLADGKITRREFITRVTATGAAAAVPGLLASAEAMAATPKKGGRLIAGLSGAASNDVLDPGTGCCATYMGALQYQLRNTLTEVDSGFAPSPALATEWEATNGPSEWTFRLRDDVEFHNGRPFTSEDVKVTMQYHQGEESTSPAKPIIGQVANIRTPDPKTVVFELSGPNADFAALLGDYHLQIMPADITYDEWDTSGEGTGPFKLVEFEPGVRSLVERNPNYWRESMPYFDEVEMLAITDVNARTNAVKTGEVHLIDQPDAKTVHLLKMQPGVKVLQTPTTRHYTIPMRTDHAPLDNNDVRLAFKYCIPREDILKKVAGGLGTLGNDHPISPLQRYFNKDLPQRQFDPDKAAFHIKKSGHADYVYELHAADTAFGGSVDAALLIQHAAKQANIQVNAIRAPNDGYWTDVWMNKDIGMCYWGGRPTEDWMFSTAYEADASWNDAFWKHERFNELLYQARGELNNDLRREMYYEMQQICSDEGGTVCMMFADAVAALSDKIKFNEPLRGNFELDGLHFSEAWWFA